MLGVRFHVPSQQTAHHQTGLVRVRGSDRVRVSVSVRVCVRVRI